MAIDKAGDHGLTSGIKHWKAVADCERLQPGKGSDGLNDAVPDQD